MTDNRQSEALRLAEQYDYGDPVAHSNTWKAAVCNELRRLHAENTTLQQGYDAARLEIEALRMRSAAPVRDYPPLPDFETVEQHIYGACRRYITQDMLEPIHNLIRDVIDADRAMRAQAAPAAVASPLTKLQRKAIAVCFTSDKVSVSEVQRKLSISYADAQTLCQSIVDLGLTDELELAPSLKRGAPAPHPAPVAQGDALPREEFAWMVVQEACETEPADEDDPECIRILRRDLKSAVLAAFLREDAARMDKEGDQHG